MKVDLDDILKLKQLDRGEALTDTVAYGEQFRSGWQLGKENTPSVNVDGLHEILVIGTGGGSAASVYLLKSYLFDVLPVPLFISQGYTLPAYVDEHTLLIVVTHSGNTEEIVSAYQEGILRGAKIMVLTAGGEALRLAESHGHALIKVPGGMMPRIALGFIFLPLLAALQDMGLISNQEIAVSEAIEVLEKLARQYGPDSPSEYNLAKQLAGAMDGLTPVIYGTLPFSEGVAVRWKNQMGENAKLWSGWNAIPALHHDEAVGWDQPTAMQRHLFYLFLRDSEDSGKIQKRIEVSQELIRPNAGGVAEVISVGQGRLARMFSLVYLGDFVTLYLALLRGLDPTPVEIVDLFKQRMGQALAEVKGRT